MIKTEDVKKLALLARIETSDNEAEGLKKDLNKILEYFEVFEKASVKDEYSPDMSLQNVSREDNDTQSRNRFTEDLLELAPKRKDNYYQVKKILKNDK